MLCKGEEQRTARGGAGPPRKADFPHLTLSRRQTPHIPRLRGACSAFVRGFVFLFFCFFSGFVPESADSAQLEAWLSYGLWGPGKPPSLGPLTPNPGSSSEPEVRFESVGIRPRGFRHQVSVCYVHEGDEEAGGWGPGLLGLRAEEYSSRLQRVGGV